MTTAPLSMSLRRLPASIILLLKPFSLEYLQTVVFILVIASLVQVVEMFIRKSSPSLYKALGIYLPLITTNCIVLGIAILNITNNYNLLESFTASVAAGLGFTLVILMSNIRERLELSAVPQSFKGMPIAFITAGLMALSFMGFDKAMLSNLHLLVVNSSRFQDGRICLRMQSSALTPAKPDARLLLHRQYRV